MVWHDQLLISQYCWFISECGLIFLPGLRSRRACVEITRLKVKVKSRKFCQIILRSLYVLTSLKTWSVYLHKILSKQGSENTARGFKFTKITFIYCMVQQVYWKFSENSKISWKLYGFLKHDEIFKYCLVFWTLWNIIRFSKHYEILYGFLNIVKYCMVSLTL